MNGRWLAWADALDGPSVGLGVAAVEAIEGALKPFDGAIEDLLASLPGHWIAKPTSARARQGL